ncbi:MAG: PIG-L family deacetylase [Ruminiclostridium sp.]|nr:PIG-L family deacetylase [Ruminiclostridium sp.]
MKTEKTILSCILSLSLLLSANICSHVYAVDGNGIEAREGEGAEEETQEEAQNGMQEEVQAAQPIEYTVEGLDDYSTYCISDGEYSTSLNTEQYGFTVSSEKEFRYVYVVWNAPPEEYTLECETGAVKEDDGVIHKLITLDAPVKSFNFKSESGGILTDIYLFDSDNFPENVQTWQPPCEQADIVVLSTHADDEYLMFGGTIPYYAKELGLKVQILYTTTHFHQQPRPHELLDALWHAGVRNYPVFGVVADTWLITTIEEAKQHFDFDTVREWLVEQIRRFKPSVLVTHDINGEYGHGAHMMSAQLTMDAVELTANANEYPKSAEKYGVWDVPKTYLHFWEENAIEFDWEIPLQSFGGITAKEAAQECFEIHKSQTIYPELYVGYQKYYDCRQFGLYRTLVGVDEKADFMDHITPLAELTTVPETEPVTEPETEPITEAPVTSDNSADTVNEETTVGDTGNPNSTNPVVMICIAVGTVVLIGLAVMVYGKLNGRKNKKK